MDSIKMQDILGLAGWCALCLAVGGLGSWATDMSVGNWYAGLVKPSWNPPNWLFGPVWTALYLMMGGAAWLVWKKTGFSAGKFPLGLFFLQLALNAAWSWLFFALRNPLAGLLDIALLWMAIAATMASFRPISAAAFWLFVPYLQWVTYAASLNGALYGLNRA